MNTRLGDLATIVRSKNAGPFELTIDVMFADAATYQLVKDSGVLTRELIAERYGVALTEVSATFFFDAALAFKANLVRRVSSGSVGDRDVFGAQQHVPMLDVLIPIN